MTACKDKQDYSYQGEAGLLVNRTARIRANVKINKTPRLWSSHNLEKLILIKIEMDFF